MGLEGGGSRIAIGRQRASDANFDFDLALDR